jgi:hypothetical protein
MSDLQIKIVTATTPVVFEQRVNELLKAGNWRVAETEMSVTDHHYYALLIQEEVKIVNVKEVR